MNSRHHLKSMLTAIALTMLPRKLFEENLPLIERVIAYVSRKNGLVGADAEDFASISRLALMENNFAILAHYDGRAPLGAYLSVVVQRLLFEQRNRQFGRWRPSAEAKRMGDAGVLLEKLLVRDRRSLREAIPIVATSHADLAASQIEEMAARLPSRAPRFRPVVLDEIPERVLAADDTSSCRVDDREHHRVCDATRRVLRETLAAMSGEDRTLLRMRFASSMTISCIARVLDVPQRPLYRRIEALLDRLRDVLAAAGIDAATIGGIIGSPTADLDFGLAAAA